MEPFARFRTVTSSVDDLEGFIIDLLDELSAATDIDFTVTPVADGQYGTMVDGRWNGMIGELERHVSNITCTTKNICALHNIVFVFSVLKLSALLLHAKLL